MAYVPFAVVALAGQLSAAWPPGPTDMRAYWFSTVLLVVCAAGIVRRRAVLPPTFLVGASVYTASVALLMLASGGIDSGFGVLLFMPFVGVALYGERWESAVTLVMVLAALLAVSLAGPHIAGAIPRRLFLIGSIGAMLSIAIHALRRRLVEANERSTRLLNQEAAINTAARQLTLLSEPAAIAALGTQLATRIASPLGSEIRRASYLRVEGGMVSVYAQCDELGLHIVESWPLREHPGLRDAVATGQPVAAPLDPEELGPVFRAVLAESGITHGAWVPVCPDGVLHGVLALSSRGAPLPAECVDRCIALGYFLELALANWAAHQELEQQATAEERRRIAASCTTAWRTSWRSSPARPGASRLSVRPRWTCGSWPAPPTGPWTRRAGPSRSSRSRTRSRCAAPSHRRRRISGPASGWTSISSSPKTSTCPAR